MGKRDVVQYLRLVNILRADIVRLGEGRWAESKMFGE